VKQDADLSELIWPVPDILSILSRSMELKPDDVVMTGTPAGVGAIVAGDKVTGGIDGLGEIDITVGQPIVRRSLRVVRS
jgi:fumarylpyruvate hydrolase